MRRCERIAAALCAALLASAAGSEELVVLTWGGAYEDSQRAAYFDPFEEKTGIAVRAEQYNGGIVALREAVESGEPGWDVVDLVAADAEAACEEDLLVKLTPDMLAPSPDGTQPEDDFDDGALMDCAVAQLVFATVIAYDARAFPEEKPRRVADFFDIERFPGRRALRCTPEAALEWALLAYGVPYTQVYDLLSTSRGLDLAFRKLDSIRDHLDWWRGGEEPVELLRERRVAMASGYNGRFFAARLDSNTPISVIWDGQLVDHATWAIPRGVAKEKLARRFIRFATSAGPLADQASRISYGPTRESARRRVGLHVNAEIDMNNHLPTSGDRLNHAIRQDADWYAKTAKLRQRRFREWLGEAGCGIAE